MKALKPLLGLVFALATLGALATPARAQLTSITGLFTTGVDASGVLLGNNVQETHYVVTSNPAGTDNVGAYTVRTNAMPGSWLDNTTTARWVVATNDKASPGNDPSRVAGTYDYTLTFNMPAGAQLTTVSITGAGAADNSATILVNDALVVGQSITAKDAAYAFTLDSSNAAFTAGSNTITFRVNNTSKSATGLMISSLSGSVIVPETAAYLPVAAAVGVYGVSVVTAFLRRRWRKRQDG